MIDKIRLENFQSHEDTLVEFSPGVNVIVGTSDSGKTSILRAFRMVVENRPSGESLVSHWAKKDGKIIDPLVVSLFVDGREIVRERGKENLYSLDDEDFKAFGMDVPDKILSLLNLSDINIQGQHDSVFMLSESPGEVARKLNQVVNLDQIDSSLKEIESRRREINKSVKDQGATIKGLEVDVKALAWIDDAETDVSELEMLIAEHHKKEKEGEWLGQFIQDYEQIDLTIYDLLPDLEGDAQILGDLLESKSELNESMSGIRTILGDINQLVIPEGDFDGALLDIHEVIQQQERRGRSADTILKLENYLIEIREIDRSTGMLGDQIKEHEDMLPDNCPVCGEKLDGDHRE